MHVARDIDQDTERNGEVLLTIVPTGRDEDASQEFLLPEPESVPAPIANLAEARAANPRVRPILVADPFDAPAPTDVVPALSLPPAKATAELELADAARAAPGGPVALPAR